MLVVPFFVDWSDHRAVFEREASALIGHPVKVKGEAKANFLPIPTFTFEKIEVADNRGELLMSANRLRLRLELLPLLQRSFEVVDMQLDSPQISLRLDEEGQSNWKLDGVVPKIGEEFNIKLGPVTVRNGAIYLADQQLKKSFRLNDIKTTITAQSLKGPWKLDGSFETAAEHFAFKLSTGKVTQGKLRAKTILKPRSLDFDALFDGELHFVDEAGSPSLPRYAGGLDLTTRADREQTADAKKTLIGEHDWRLAGRFDLSRDRLSLQDASFDNAENASLPTFNGSLEINYASEMRFKADVSARQIDLDRTYGKDKKAPVSIGSAFNHLADFISVLPKPPIEGAIGVDIPGIVMGGDVVRSLRFNAKPAGDGWRIDDFVALLPGETRMEFSGDLASVNDLMIDGDINLISERAVGLARWLRPASGNDARRIQIDNFSINGKLAAEKTAFRLSEMQANLGESDLSGRLSFGRISSRQKRFEADLNANKLDIDGVQSLAALFVGQRNLSGFGASDRIAIKLHADKLISDTLEGQNADIDLAIADGEIDINRLKLDDFAGVEMDMSGSMRNVLAKPAGRFSGQLKADGVAGLIKIGETLTPDHPVLDYLRRHGDALVPLDVTVTFSGDQASDDKNKPPSDFAATVTGILGGGEISTGVRFLGDWQKPLDGTIEASFNGIFAKSADFLKQLGRPVIDDGFAGKATLDLRARGKPRSGIALLANVTMAAVDLSSELQVTVSDEVIPSYSGTVDLTGEDVEPLLTLLGYTLPASGLGSDVILKTKIKGAGWKGKLHGIEGTIAGNNVGGNLGYDKMSQSASDLLKWSGDLAIERVSLPWLAALVTGEVITPIDLEIIPEGVESSENEEDFTDDPEETPLGPSFWSQADYSKPYLGNIYADISLTADAIDLTNLRELENAKVGVRLRPDSLELSDLKANFANGTLTGRLLFENNDGLVAISGLADLNGAAAQDLLWDDGVRPLVEGRFGFSSQFSGSGRSLDAVIASLGGGGSISLSQARLRRFNPSTFGLLLEAADGRLKLDEENLTPLAEQHLDAGAFGFNKAETSFTLNSGVLRIADVAFQEGSLETMIAGTLDLPLLTLKGSVTLLADPTSLVGKPVSGSTPEIAVLFEGPVDQPVRTLDLKPMLGYLTVRRFEQEVRRVEILQADILEKQRLSRYARWLDYQEEWERKETARKVAEEAEKARVKKIRFEQEAREQAERLAAEQAAALAASNSDQTQQPTNEPSAPINLQDLDDTLLNQVPATQAPLELVPRSP